MRIIVAAVLVGAPAAALAAGVGPVSPAYRQVTPGSSVQFTATGPVTWQVDGVIGGTAASGTITPSGLYTAPSRLPSPAAVVVTAQGADAIEDRASATITLLARLPTGHTYIVATTGSDSNPGTAAAPFATLQHAADVAQAGDTVLARAGVYHQLLAPPRSGDTAHGPITYASYPNETATLDGTGLPVPGGQYGMITLSGVSNVVVQGFEVRNYRTASNRQVPIGIYVLGAGSAVQIVGNHIHDIVTTGKTTARACASDALGLLVAGSKAPASMDAVVVSGNELDHLVTGCSESMTMDGNVTNFAVVANNVHDNDNIGIDAAGYERVSPDPAYDQPRGGVIRGNLVHDITSFGNPDYGNAYASDGIYVDGGRDLVIEQNIIHHTDFGIELASEHKGRLTSGVVARNNLSYANNAAGITIGGYGAARGGTDNCTIVGNTLYGNDTKSTGAGEIQIQYNATNNLIEDNIVQAGPQGLILRAYVAAPPGAPPPATLNHNVYWTTTVSTFVWLHARYTSLAAYQAASSQDAQSIFADPRFRDSSATPPDLDIASNSPAAGTGVVTPASGSVDVAGAPRGGQGTISIGAWQP